MIKAYREEHVYVYSPSESIEAQTTANMWKKVYEIQGYDTRLDISPETITLTATRILGVEGEEE